MSLRRFHCNCSCPNKGQDMGQEREEQEHSRVQWCWTAGRGWGRSTAGCSGIGQQGGGRGAVLTLFIFRRPRQP